MGCYPPKPKPNKKLVSRLRTVSLHAEDMLASEIQKEHLEKKMKRVRTKLKILYHLKKDNTQNKTQNTKQQHE